MGTPNAKRLMLTIIKQTIKDFLFKTKSTRNELKYISKLEKKNHSSRDTAFRAHTK